MIRLLLALPFMVLVVYSVHSAFKYTRMISNIFLGLVYSPVPEKGASPAGERIVILDSADREIEALLVERKDSQKLAIFCHESGSSKESWEKYLYFLPAAGYHVLSVDFAVKNEPSDPLSQWPTEADVERLLTVLRWAKKAFAPGTHVALVGVSKGANIALAASSRDESVSAVVTDGLFSMKEIFRDYIRRWAPVLVRPNLFGDRYPDWVVNIFSNLGYWYCQKQSKRRFLDVEAILRRRRRPLLMIHGGEDDYVPASHQIFLDKICRRDVSARHWVVPQARHNEAVTLDRKTYENEVLSFLGREVR